MNTASVFSSISMSLWHLLAYLLNSVVEKLIIEDRNSVVSIHVIPVIMFHYHVVIERSRSMEMKMTREFFCKMEFTCLIKSLRSTDRLPTKDV